MVICSICLGSWIWMTAGSVDSSSGGIIISECFCSFLWSWKEYSQVKRHKIDPSLILTYLINIKTPFYSLFLLAHISCFGLLPVIHVASALLPFIYNKQWRAIISCNYLRTTPKGCSTTKYNSSSRNPLQARWSAPCCSSTPKAWNTTNLSRAINTSISKRRWSNSSPVRKNYSLIRRKRRWIVRCGRRSIVKMNRRRWRLWRWRRNRRRWKIRLMRGSKGMSPNGRRRRSLKVPIRRKNLLKIK